MRAVRRWVTGKGSYSNWSILSVVPYNIFYGLHPRSLEAADHIPESSSKINVSSKINEAYALIKRILYPDKVPLESTTGLRRTSDASITSDADSSFIDDWESVIPDVTDQPTEGVPLGLIGNALYAEYLRTDHTKPIVLVDAELEAEKVVSRLVQLLKGPKVSEVCSPLLNYLERGFPQPEK